MNRCINTETGITIEIETLVECATRGDTEAFGRLYDVYADRVYRHIYYRTGNAEDARDLTQEVFLKAWQALPRYRRSRTPFLGWLFTISHNRVIDYYRTKKDYVRFNDEIAVDGLSKNPERYIEDQFNLQEVRKAILQLPYDQQQVILMNFIEGFEYAEIAKIMNKGEGNIRVILHRALKRVREILSKAGH